MKHRSDILFVYWEYKKLFPLDIKNDFELERWKKLYQLDIIKYSRMVSEIKNLKNINEIISLDFDYDNYFIVLESLVNSWFLYIKENQKLFYQQQNKNDFDIE